MPAKVAFTDPNTVVSPTDRWELLHVLYDGKEGSWSCAEGLWEGEPSLALRWNCGGSEPAIGNPESSGRAVWFIVPPEIEARVREAVRDVQSQK